MTVETFLAQYGWVGFIVFILIDKVWPFLRDKFFPAKMKEGEDRRKAALQQAEDERKARLEELADERKWHREMETERLAEMKIIGEAVQAIRLALVQNGADNAAIRVATDEIKSRQYMIINKLDIHHDATMDAVADMREAVARRNGIEQGKKLPKTGPFKEGDKPE